MSGEEFSSKGEFSVDKFFDGLRTPAKGHLTAGGELDPEYIHDHLLGKLFLLSLRVGQLRSAGGDHLVVRAIRVIADQAPEKEKVFIKEEIRKQTQSLGADVVNEALSEEDK